MWHFLSPPSYRECWVCIKEWARRWPEWRPWWPSASSDLDLESSCSRVTRPSRSGLYEAEWRWRRSGGEHGAETRWWKETEFWNIKREEVINNRKNLKTCLLRTSSSLCPFTKLWFIKWDNERRCIIRWTESEIQLCSDFADMLTGQIRLLRNIFIYSKSPCSRHSVLRWA